MSALTIEAPILQAAGGRSLKPVSRVRPLRAPVGKPRRPLHPARPVPVPARPSIARAAIRPGRVELTERGIVVILSVFLAVMVTAAVVAVSVFLAVPNDPVGVGPTSPGVLGGQWR